MQISNVKNLPQVFVDALQGNYDKQKQYDTNPDYRVTQLGMPPRLAMLRKRHNQDLVHDAYDLYHAMLGHGIHEYIQNGLEDNPKYDVEKRVCKKVFDKLVCGTMDLYDKETGFIEDHKTVSTYVYGSDVKQEWIEQLNIYAYILETEENLPVNGLRIHMVFKDWRENAGRYSGISDYPQTPCLYLDVPLLPLKERQELFEAKVQTLIDLEDVSDESLPLCTAEDMWEKPASFAVYKQGAQRATRLCPTYQAAEDYIKYKGKAGVDLKIEHRQGVRTRCEKYCDVNKYCNQYAEWVKQNDQDTANQVYDNIATVAEAA